MRVCDPICDFCTFYAFNANEDGAYTGDGECRHFDHPRPCEPWEGCKDFKCELCSDTPEMHWQLPQQEGED